MPKTFTLNIYEIPKLRPCSRYRNDCTQGPCVHWGFSVCIGLSTDRLAVNACTVSR